MKDQSRINSAPPDFDMVGHNKGFWIRAVDDASVQGNVVTVSLYNNGEEIETQVKKRDNLEGYIKQHFDELWAGGQPDDLMINPI